MPIPRPASDCALHRGPLLVISNGHGEDTIGMAVVDAVRTRVGEALAVHAWPMVGDGAAYRTAGVTCIADGLRLPSEGFGTLSVRALVRDLRAGWLGGHIRQVQFARTLRGRYAAVLAVGDIVPMLAAKAAATPFAFVGCAKSTYYGRAGAYSRLERWLLRRSAVACYPRDRPTTDALVRHGVAARYLGNPMMDGVAPTGVAPKWRAGEVVVAVLPGSRSDREANALHVLRLIAEAHATYASVGPVHFAFVVTPAFALPAVMEQASRQAALDDTRWRPLPEGDGLRLGALRASFSVAAFGDVVPRARVAIALAGTANEQAVGVGTPIVTFATAGPQGEAYLRMKMPWFGASAMQVAPEAAALAGAVRRILRDDLLHARMQRAGRERMGVPGASRAIADDLVRTLDLRGGA
jgi:uncharacterized protein (TIGR03492 family)